MTSNDKEQKVGFFFPVRDTVRVIRGARVKCLPKTEYNHRHHVAIDVLRLMASVRPIGSYSQDSGVHDSVRKLIILHMGDAHTPLWTKYYGTQMLEEIRASGNDLYINWTNHAPDTERERENVVAIDPMYWVHLFEFLHLGANYTTGTNTVTFTGSPKLEKDENRVKTAPTLSFVARRARFHGVDNRDILFVYFIASALRYKPQGYQALIASKNGEGIDKTHARLQNLTAEKINELWTDITSNVDYNFNQESNPTQNPSEVATEADFKADWMDVLNYMSINLPESDEVGNVGADFAGEVNLTSTNEGELALLESERSDLADDGADGDGGVAGDDLFPEEGGFTDEGFAEEEVVAAAIGQARKDIANEFLVTKAKDQLHVKGVDPVKIAASMLVRNLVPGHKERCVALEAAAGRNALGPYTANKLDDAKARLHSQMIDNSDSYADAWYSLAKCVGAAMGTKETAAVRDFSADVYSAPGVLTHEKPLKLADRVADLLTVYGGGKDRHSSKGRRSWTSLWRGGREKASEALCDAINKYVLKKPQLSVDEVTELAGAMVKA